jgi:hypothetical protein
MDGEERGAAARSKLVFERSQHGELGAKSTEDIGVDHRVELHRAERQRGAGRDHDRGAVVEVLAPCAAPGRLECRHWQVGADDAATCRLREVERGPPAPRSDIEQPVTGPDT